MTNCQYHGYSYYNTNTNNDNEKILNIADSYVISTT